MPTLKYIDGIRFFIYSNEHLPLHIHVEKGDGYAKFNLSPVELIKSSGLTVSQLRKISNLVEENKKEFIGKWHEYFSNN